MEFGPGATVIQAPNGFGKSALLKSLYDAFGAEPHRVDDRWKSERVVTAVEFTIDGVVRTIVKSGGMYAIFDEAGVWQFQTSSVTSGLGPYLAELLDFRLLMMDQRQNVLVPPPAYAFAPYYVDQDKSWTEAWVPFTGMYLPDSARTLADYHSGLKPNEYYVARSERDRMLRELSEVELRRRGLVNAVDHLKETAPDLALHLTLADFEDETARLVEESQRLHEREVEHREKLAELAEVRALWSAQLAVARAALSELDEVFASSTHQPVDVECPSCGEHYSNDIAARFKIAADGDSLTTVAQQAQEEIKKTSAEIEKVRLNVSAVAEAIVRVQAVLSTRRRDISLGDVVAAEGRNAATHVLRQRIDEADTAIGHLTSLIKERRAEMRRLLDKKRAQSIMDYYFNQLYRVAQRLNVGLENGGSIASPPRARGSEGPRGLTVYYYAFLHTVREYGSATFCPIVVDEPNQQGQDGEHLPAIIQMLVADRPKDSQVILAVNQAVGVSSDGAAIIPVGQARNQLLSEEAYDKVAAHLVPLLTRMVQ
ncbi:hypothetical protein ACI6QG_10420 [Roseococcus sp. DSY-14]|uniref:hypothetical protein n=1 Tax=Roseococcus sp. DSY-14 TaxID=3369650 RepID=UPI00387B878A